MLNAKNIRTKRPSKKLAPKLYGPFKILEQRGELAYKLEISDRWKIHPVFHVSLLDVQNVNARGTIYSMWIILRKCEGGCDARLVRSREQIW